MEILCPVCEHEFPEQDLEEGAVLECEACRSVFEVVNLEPLELLLVESGEGVQVECPRCGHVFQVLDEDVASCPECGRQFAVHVDEMDEEEEDWE